MKNILVGIDFHEKTDLLVDKAFELAKAFGSKVWLVHVAAPEPDFAGYSVGPQYVRDQRAEELRDEHKQLQKYADELKEKGIDADGLLIEGATIDMIEAEAEKLGTDLVICGHHEHSFLYKAFFGSMSVQVVERLKVPVLVVPFGK